VSTNLPQVSITDQGEAGSERRDLVALKAVLACDPELFVNVVGQPSVVLPLVGDRRAGVPYRIDSLRVRAELFGVICDAAGMLPFEQEVTRILRYLESQAWKTPRTTVEYAAAVDSHPVIEAVHILLHATKVGSVHESTATKLLKDLEQVARANSIDVQQKPWPKAANALSEQLHEFRETLAKGGISFDRGRSDGIRWIRFTRTQVAGDDDGSSALDRPGSNLSEGNELAATAERAGDTEAVFGRIQSTSNGAST
jgi:hypothetical protein